MSNDIGPALSNGERVSFKSGTQITIDTQNQLDVAIIRTKSGSIPEILPAAHALTLERFEGGYHLNFANENLDAQSMYLIVVFTSVNPLGDVLLSLGQEAGHYALKNIQSGAQIVGSIYHKKDEWKIKIGGDNYPSGIGQVIQLYKD